MQLARAVAVAIAASLPFQGQADDAAKAPHVRAMGNRTLIEPGTYRLHDFFAQMSAQLKRSDLCNWMNNPQHEQERFVIPQPILVEPGELENLFARLMFTKSYVPVPVDEAKGIWRWIFLPGPERGAIRVSALELTLEQLRAWRGPATRCVNVAYRLSQPIETGVLEQVLNEGHVPGMGTAATAVGQVIMISHFADVAQKMVARLDAFEAAASRPASQPAMAPDRIDAIEKRLARIEQKLDDLARAIEKR